MLWLDILLLALLGLFAAGVVISAGAVVWRRLSDRGLADQAVALDQRLREQGYAGLKVTASVNLPEVKLTCTAPSPEGVTLILDTRPDRLPEGGLLPRTGLPPLDRVFPSCGLSPRAALHLRANLGRLRRAELFLRGWRDRCSRISVHGRSLTLVFNEPLRSRNDTERLPDRLLLKALPQAALFLKTLLSCAWWGPPVERVVGADAGAGGTRGAYRDAGQLPSERWELEDPRGAPPVEAGLGPFETAQLAAWLRGGQLCWLDRIRRPGAAHPWQHLIEVEALQIFVPQPAEGSVDDRRGGRSWRPWSRLRAHVAGALARPAALPAAVLLGLLLLLPLSWAAAELALGRLSRGWPSAAGTITRSSVVRTEKTSKQRTTVTYTLQIDYSYRVGARWMHGSRVRFGDDGAGEHRAAELVRRYPAGRDVRVRYAPSAPELCTLEPGQPPAQAALVAALGGLFALTALAAAALTVRRLRAWLARRRRLTPG